MIAHYRNSQSYPLETIYGNHLQKLLFKLIGGGASEVMSDVIAKVEGF